MSATMPSRARLSGSSDATNRATVEASAVAPVGAAPIDQLRVNSALRRDAARRPAR